MSVHVIRYAFALLLGLLWFAGMGEGADGPAASARRLSLPEECLLVIRVKSMERLCADVDELLARMIPEREPVSLLASFADEMSSRKLTGIDLESPIYLFYMNPQKYKYPWVCVFHAPDKRLLAGGWRSNGLRVGNMGKDEWLLTSAIPFVPGSGQVWFDGTTAVSGQTEAAVHSVRDWRRAGNKWSDLAGEDEDMLVRFNVAKTLSVYADRLERERGKMLSRMREAISSKVPDGEGEADIQAAGQQLDAAMVLLRQIAAADASLYFGDSRLRMSAGVRAMESSPLAGIIEAQPAGSMEPLELCPADAMLVVAHELALKEQLKRSVVLAARMLSLGGEEAGGLAEMSGRSLYALCAGTDGVFSLLSVQRGKGIAASVAWWRRCHNEGSGRGYALENSSPRNQDAAGIVTADVLFDEAVLGARMTQAGKRLLGPRIAAAQHVDADRAVICLGEDAVGRVQALLARERAGERGVGGTASLLATLKGLPSRPNFLVYVAPPGVRGWLSLAGFEVGKAAADEQGFAVAMAGGGEGRLDIGCVIPTRAILEARLRP